MGYSIVSQNNGNTTNQSSNSPHRPTSDSDQCPTSPQTSIHPASYHAYQPPSHTRADSPRLCPGADLTSAPVTESDGDTSKARIVNIVAEPSVHDVLHIHVNPSLPPTQSPETRVYSSEAQNTVVGPATPCPLYTRLPHPDLPVVIELEWWQVLDGWIASDESQTLPPEYQVATAGPMSPPRACSLFSSEYVLSMSAAEPMDGLPMGTSWVNSLATTHLASGMSSVLDRLSPLSIALVGLPDVEDIANNKDNELTETSNEEYAVPEYEEQGNDDIRTLEG